MQFGSAARLPVSNPVVTWNPSAPVLPVLNVKATAVQTPKVGEVKNLASDLDNSVHGVLNSLTGKTTNTSWYWLVGIAVALVLIFALRK